MWPINLFSTGIVAADFPSISKGFRCLERRYLSTPNLTGGHQAGINGQASDPRSWVSAPMSHRQRVTARGTGTPGTPSASGYQPSLAVRQDTLTQAADHSGQSGADLSRGENDTPEISLSLPH